MYRLSQLPILTGLSIEECFIALTLPGQPTDSIGNLTGVSGIAAKSSLMLLQQFAQWLKTTPFSVYQLQFMLTGESQDPAIQNQILGADKIANFLNGLHTAIQPTLLTQEHFTTSLNPTLQSIFGNQTGDLTKQIYTKLQDAPVNYFDQQGIVTPAGVMATDSEIKNALQSITFPFPSVPIAFDFLDSLAVLTKNILQTSYQLQQNTLTQQLASLYSVSPALVPALEVWGGLTLGDLEPNQVVSLGKENPYAAAPLLQHLLAKLTERWSKLMVLSADNQDIVVRLQLLQQYAVFLTNLGLSAAEVQAMVDHPAYFGISYNSGGAESVILQFTLSNVQTLYQFKQLVQVLQDTQNHLLDYFTVANTDNDLVKIAQKLAKFTQWDATQIQFLLQQLWPSSIEPNRVPEYATVAGVAQLQAYFGLAEQLNLDIVSLYNFTQISSKTDYSTYQGLADALWGGLQKQYHGQPKVLSALQGKLEEAKRSALLELVINYLSTEKKLPISIARDLYEYLLIDVEVSGIVETSYINEAISAVQLYIYRCLNSLEPGVMVEEELHKWWSWVEHYRTWQANREVFLYPENYIQPELRQDKTPQFTQLENGLKQSNLTAEVVGTAVKTYLDGFAEVATLEIVGSYLYANDANNPANQQTLYLVGRTATKAYTYYYRSATFTWDAHQETYVPIQWTPWIEINLQIKSTCVTPIYAFDRLFLFWAETKPGPSDKDAQGKTTNKRFESTLYYAFYDFNQQWSAPQQLLEEPILLPDSVTTQAAAETLVWQQVRAVAVTDTASKSQLIYWGWGAQQQGCIWTGTLNKQFKVKTIMPLEVPLNGGTQVNTVVYQDDLYCFYQGPQNEIWYNIFGNRSWQSSMRAPGAGLWYTPTVAANQGNLYYFYNKWGEGNKGSLYYNFFKDGKWQTPEPVATAKHIIFAPSAVFYKDKCYIFCQDEDNPGRMDILQFSNNSLLLAKPIDNVNTWSICESPSAVVFQDKLYCFVQYKVNGKANYLYYITSKDGQNFTSYQAVPGVSMCGSPSAVVFQGKLYCFYQCADDKGNPTSELRYAVLKEDGTAWDSGQVVGANMIIASPSYLQPSAVAYQDNLYCFYLHRDGNIRCVPVFLNINSTVLSFVNSVKDLQNNMPPRVVPGTALSWSIDPGPDGTQFLSIPIQNSNKKKEIRLNSMVAHDLSQVLFSQGLDGFLSITTQKTPEINIDGTQTPTLDFAGANGLYYWELFFQVPFLVGHSLSTQQQFDLAKKWYEYIFNPTISKKNWDLVAQEDPNDKYWRFLGLRSQYNTVLQTELDEPWSQEIQQDVQDAGQLAAYHNDPFDPHAIARLRPIAYQKTLVMHYIDNLLAWGDNLFRQYTTETIVEATMLYVMAYDLLGKQPVSLGSCPLPVPETLTEIAQFYGGKLGNIPEFLIQIEQSQSNVLVANVQDTPHNYIPGDYFGLPENGQFTAYWDKVKQRLYNIRHSLNIDGVYEQLALFQPPINPMQLVAAVGAGEGVGGALTDGQVDVPYYRFSVVVAKAQSMTQTVVQLGQSLLSVLEKQDAEQLSLLYNSNQQNLLALTRTSKQDQLNAASQNVQALQASLQNAQDRLDHYTRLINNDLSSGEKAQIQLEGTAINLQLLAQPIKTAAIAGYLTPTVFGLADGDFKPGDAIMQGANVLEGTANLRSMAAGLAGTIAGYQRRAEDWQLQQSLAQADVEQIQYQILSAQYQERIANEDIKLLEKQIDQEQGVQTFLKNKFTRAALYQWMTGKLSALYFQAYQLAYNLALQAEKAWQFERGNQQTFITANYWNDLYHGLVAGESLQFDLQRMEKAYMDKDMRTFEIEKTISLGQLDPQALKDLK